MRRIYAGIQLAGRHGAANFRIDAW